jgi:hydroxymethylpyrimidine pyrophosphatase-like HAD family hydrolase
MAFSLVAVDLDGTLLQWKTQQDRDSEDSATPSISPANTEALRRVSSDGATVVIATGRGPASATRVADDVLALPCPLVCNNGACVLSAPTAACGRREIIQSSFYPRDFVAGVAGIAGSVNTLVCIYHPEPESPSGCAISFSVRAASLPQHLSLTSSVSTCKFSATRQCLTPPPQPVGLHPG